MNLKENIQNMIIFVKFTLNAGFSKQSFLNYSTEVKANQHIPYMYIHTHKFSNIKYIKWILMNTFLAVYIAKVLGIR